MRALHDSIRHGRRDRRLRGEAQRRLKKFAGLLLAKCQRAQASAIGRVKAAVRVKKAAAEARRRRHEEAAAAAKLAAKQAALPQRAMGAVGASGAPGVAGESRRAAVVAVRHAPAATAGGGELE